jgi:excisionase family DNA binding protein
MKSETNEAPDAGGLVTVADAAKYLAVSRSKLYEEMDAGRLAYVKLGRARRIRRAALEHLIEVSTVGGHSVA